MENIRKATGADLARIAEILIFNYRLHFYPIFRNDDYYFNELQTSKLMRQYEDGIGTTWVYDDGAVKGFIQVEGGEISKLFMEPVLQGNSIGSALLEFAVGKLNANGLWALEKNLRAIAFYQWHGFRVSGEQKGEEGTTEYLVRLVREAGSSSPGAEGYSIGSGREGD